MLNKEIGSAWLLSVALQMDKVLIMFAGEDVFFPHAAAFTLTPFLNIESNKTEKTTLSRGFKAIAYSLELIKIRCCLYFFLYFQHSRGAKDQEETIRINNWRERERWHRHQCRSLAQEMCFHSKSSPDPCNEFYSKLSKHGCFLKAWPLSVIWGSLCAFSEGNLNLQCRPCPAPDAQRPPVAFCVWALMYEAVNQSSWMHTHQRETPWCIYKSLSEVLKTAGQVCDEVMAALCSMLSNRQHQELFNKVKRKLM